MTWILHLGWIPVIVGIWKGRGWLLSIESKMADTVDTIKTNAEQTAIVATEQKKLREAAELHWKTEEDSLRTIRADLQENTKTMNEVSKSFQQLIEAVRHQSDVHGEQFKMIRSISEQQLTLGTNQSNITNGMQRVVEQLISMMKET